MKLSFTLFALILAAGLMALPSPLALAQISANDAAPPVATPATQDPARVQAALYRFDSAVASRNLGQLQALGIKPASAKRWQKFFKDNPGASVTDDCPVSSLAILGNTATWSCTETATVVSEGKPMPYLLAVRFTFTRQNGEWLILDRR